MAEIYNITIEQNATFNLPIKLTTVSESIETPQDLTGYTTSGQIKKTYGGAVIETFHVSNVLGVSGNIEYSLTAAETLAMPVGTYLYDILIVTGSVQKRVLEGQAIVSPYITSL